MRLTTMLVVASLLIACGIANAEEVAKRAGGNANSEALTRAQTAARDAAAQRDALQVELEKSKKEVAEHDRQQKKEVAQLKERIAQLEKETAKTEQQNTRNQETGNALRDRIKDQQEKLQKVVDKYKELVETLRQVETDRTQLQATSKTQATQLDTCSNDNIKLHDLGLELADLYENKGVWAALVEKEPVTQLKRVELENRVQEYRHRASRLQFDSATAVR